MEEEIKDCRKIIYLDENFSHINKINCIICNKEIKALEERITTPWSGMWNDGTVDKFASNYGSIHDSDVFLLGICDNCVIEKLKTKQLIYLYNYMNDNLKNKKETEI